MTLTEKSAWALIPGKKAEDFMVQKTVEIKVKILRPFYFGNELLEKGRTVTLPVQLANEMAVCNKVEAIIPIPTLPEPEPPKKTTK